MTTPEVLEVSVQVAADPETVFGYFTDPARYTRWMGNDATLNPVPGGSYRVFMRDGVETIGTFVEVDPPNRLVFTWGWTRDAEVPPGSSRVEVTLHAEAGGTRVVLRHHDLPTEQQRANHTMGWQMYLSRLVTLVAGGDPGPEPNAAADPSAAADHNPAADPNLA